MMHFGEHGLSERPDGVHHFAGLAGIGLADGDDHQIVEDAFDGQIDVDQFRDGEAHERKEDALDGFAHVGVLHGRLADDGGGVDGIFAVGDAVHVEDGVEIFERVEAGVVAEGAFGAEFVEIDVAFEDDFAGGRDFQIDGFAFDEFDGSGAEEAGDEIFFDVGRSRDDGGKSYGGVGADGDGDFHFAGGMIRFGEDLAAGGAGHEIYGGAVPTLRKGREDGAPAFRWYRRMCQHFACAWRIVFGGDFLALPVAPVVWSS